MARDQIELLLTLLDAGFDGTGAVADWHSLLGNLRGVTQEDWRWVPPGGRRSIHDIVQHVGGGKLMYHSNAFGDRSLDWESPAVLGAGRLETVADGREWLREGHARFRAAVAALADDAELARPCHHHSRPGMPARWIVQVVLQHDLYHAGEINLMRALRQGDDE